MTKKYTPEFKESAVKLANESGLPVAQTARNLGINKNTLHTWIHKARVTQNEAKTDNSSDLDEIKSLKKEILRLTQEIDLLKKAAAYFTSKIQ